MTASGLERQEAAGDGLWPGTAGGGRRRRDVPMKNGIVVALALAVAVRVCCLSISPSSALLSTSPPLYLSTYLSLLR